MSPLRTPDAGWRLAPAAAAAWRRGPARGLALLDEALARAKDPAPLHVLRAEARAAAGRFSQAVEDAERAVELAPGDASARAGLARALARAGRLEEAWKAAEKALALSPGTAWLAAESALLLLARGQAGKALAAARRAAELDASDPAASLALAAALTRAGHAEGALAALAPALRAKGGFGLGAPAPHPLSLRADLLAALERWPEAARARAAAARAGLSPAWPFPAAGRLDAALAGLSALEEPLAQAWRGQLLSEAGRDEDAVVALGAALRKAPGLPAARVWRARALSRLGRLEAALRDVRAAARKPSPAFPAGGLALFEGDLLAALGRGRAAAAAYARAASLGPDRAQARLRRALVLEALGDAEEAQRELGRCLEGDPCLRDAYRARARLRRARGDAAGAENDEARAGGAALPAVGVRDPETDQGPGEGPPQRRLGRAMGDARLELAGLLQCALTKARVPGFCRERAPEMAAYVDEALARFGPRLDKSLIDAFRRTASARANPDFPWYAAAQMMMGLTPLPDMRPRNPSWRHGEDQRFLEALRRFVRTTRFDRWCKGKAPLFRRWTAKLRPHVEKEAYAETVSAYAGRPVAAYYDVVLSPLLRDSRIRAILLDDDGSRGARTVLGPLNSEAEFAECLESPDADALLWTGWHEHLHTLLDPWCALYAPEAARFEPLYGSFPRLARRKDWMDCFSEQFVRAATQRLLLARRGWAAADALAAGDREKGYRWADPLAKALEEYESDRKKWPTLLDFMPTWLKALEGAE